MLQHQYSKTPFYGYKFRAIFEFQIEGQLSKHAIHIYTTNPDKESILDTIKKHLASNVINPEITYFTTKEQDDKDSLFLGGILNGWGDLPKEDANAVEQAANDHATRIVKDTHYDEDKIHLEYAFKIGATWQKGEDEAKYKQLLSSHNELLEILDNLKYNISVSHPDGKLYYAYTERTIAHAKTLK